jgi:para-nitrobenzyl esterase
MLNGSGPAVDALAQKTGDAWLAFARTGNPACESLGAWPAFDASGRAAMLLGAECKIEQAPMEPERRAWDQIPNLRIGGADAR